MIIYKQNRDILAANSEGIVYRSSDQSSQGDSSSGHDGRCNSRSQDENQRNTQQKEKDINLAKMPCLSLIPINLIMTPPPSTTPTIVITSSTVLTAAAKHVPPGKETDPTQSRPSFG
jgi:hypothetical protein